MMGFKYLLVLALVAINVVFAVPLTDNNAVETTTKKMMQDLVIDVEFNAIRGCNGAVVQEMAGNMCVAVPWTYRVRNTILTGNSFMTALTETGDDIFETEGRGYVANDCSGTPNLEIPYSPNTTEGCFNDEGDYELFFNGAETQSHRITSFYPVIIYHAAPNCFGATLAVATPTCVAVPWVLIRDGVTYSGSSIDVDYYMHSTDINYYADTACSGNPAYRIVSQLIGNNCVAPDVYELFIAGTKSFSYTIDQ